MDGMNDIDELEAMFRISRMDKGELEDFLADIATVDPGLGIGYSNQGLDEFVLEMKTLSETINVEQAMRRSPRDLAAAAKESAERKARKLDLTDYYRQSDYLAKVSNERSERHALCERLRNAVERRLWHLESRNGLLYRPAEQTPLERYLEALYSERRLDVR